MSAAVLSVLYATGSVIPDTAGGTHSGAGAVEDLSQPRQSSPSGQGQHARAHVRLLSGGKNPKAEALKRAKWPLGPVFRFVMLFLLVLTA